MQPGFLFGIAVIAMVGFSSLAKVDVYQMKKSLGNLAFPGLLCMFLSACGGGGSGATSPPGPPPPPASTAIALDGANAFDAGVLATGLTEASVQIALAGVNPFIDLLNAGVLQQNVVCPQSGTADVSSTDVDGDGVVSIGDTVTITYTGDCHVIPLNDPANGTIQMDVVDLQVASDEVILTARLSTPGGVTIPGTEVVSFDTSFELDVIVQSVFLEQLTINMTAPDQLTVSIDSGGTVFDEQLTQLSVQRTLLSGAGNSRPYRVNSTSGIRSDLLAGTMQCLTTSDLASPEFVRLPDSGTFECTGQANSTIRIRSDGLSAQSAPVTLLVDPEGDGSFVEAFDPTGNQLFWSSFVEGGLFLERIPRANSVGPGGPMLTTVSAAIDVNDLVYAPDIDRLFGATDSGVVEIDPATMMATRSLNIVGGPATMGLSDDETTLWVGLSDASQLQRVDVQTMTAGPSYPNSGSGDSNRIRVVPGTTDMIVVTTLNPDEMIAYDNGLQLPDTIDSNTAPFLSAPVSFVFRSPTDIVGAVTGNTAYTVFRIALDPVTGLSVQQTFRGLADQSRNRLKIGSENIYASGGRIFNETSASVEGYLRPDLCCYDDLTVDTQTGDIYTISTIGSAQGLDLYSENNYVHVGHYSIPSSPTFSRAEHAVLTGEYVVIRRNNELERYNRSDVIPNFPTDPCLRLDLSNQVTNGTYISLDCVMTDVVYDASRNLIYAGLDSFSSRGNSVAIIDPDTFSVSSYIPVGGAPRMLKMSTDGAKLYVNLLDMSKVVEIDLATQIVDRTVLLGYD